MSLNASLSIAVNSLSANTGAIQATNSNIANANTPGYSRQIVHLQEAAPIRPSGTERSSGNGVVMEGFESVRSELLQRQIQRQTQDQAGADAAVGSLQQIQSVFTTSTQDLGTQLSKLFTSLSSLSTDPTSSAVRQGVLSAAQGVASAFHAVSVSLTSTQAGLNAQVTQDVGEINRLTQQIAELNPPIAKLQAAGQDGGILQDQQDQLVLRLSRLTSVSVTHTTDGDTLTTGDGTALVIAGRSYALQTTVGSNAMQHVLDADGNDITPTLQGGDLGGTVKMRDVTIPGLLSQLDALASQFGSAMNAAQAQGFDQNGVQGANLFSVNATVTGSAAALSVALTNPQAIAASSDGTAGSNGNLAHLGAVQTSALPSGNAPQDEYADLVYKVGSLTAQATAESSASKTHLLQLNDQRSSLSGVSIDEESANLLRYQQAYQAAARVVSVINTLFSITMSMGTNAAA